MEHAFFELKLCKLTYRFRKMTLLEHQTKIIKLKSRLISAAQDPTNLSHLTQLTTRINTLTLQERDLSDLLKDPRMVRTSL